jgi:Protein of unknown function (DUF1203)
MESTNFKITGLPFAFFEPLFRLTEEELKARNARKCIVDTKPGFPCRVSLREADIGESVILISYPHHSVEGPYKSSGPIYVRETAEAAELEINEIPEVGQTRLMSIRAYGEDGMLTSSTVAEGQNVAVEIRRFFEDPKVAYLHLHNAKPGCYSCRVDRA